MHVTNVQLSWNVVETLILLIVGHTQILNVNHNQDIVIIIPANHCDPCEDETSCGGTVGNTTYCWAAVDPKCVPYNGTCQFDSPKNNCTACTSEAFCGGVEFNTTYCWLSRD